ncbi:hypothetical protein AAFF_G00311140 [Aldrovandia affinis]|uniref:Uncharacterized protein n=1 Tax=Aldrovandia affinis TaxID=143900 RepID=A0AAD7W0I7_9TELE|nr:hypothetical protein AAFF_G00311140 [Aldrovandia affinis]
MNTVQLPQDLGSTPPGPLPPITVMYYSLGQRGDSGQAGSDYFTAGEPDYRTGQQLRPAGTWKLKTEELWSGLSTG